MFVTSTTLCGIGFSGFTNISNSSITSPFFTFIIPTSVIFSVVIEIPVVSKSNTQYVASSSTCPLGFFTDFSLSGTKYASTPYITFISGLSLPNKWYASGNACTTPWSVIAIDFIPQLIALFIKSVADVIASIALILVCICNSTLFTSALSSLVVFGNGVDSTIVFAIIVNSFEKASICALPANFTAFVFPNLFTIFFAFFPGKNALHVIVLVPSYIFILNITFPVLVSLSSIPSISPSIHTFPDSAFKSVIFTNGSDIFIEFPNINGELVSSSGNCGIPSSEISIIIFAITVKSPA